MQNRPTPDRKNRPHSNVGPTGCQKTAGEREEADEDIMEPIPGDLEETGFSWH